MFKLNKKDLLLASVTCFLLACSSTQYNVPIVINDDAAQPELIKAVQSNPTNIQSKLLTLEQIMADPDWMGRQPTSAYWADDSHAVFYEQKQLGSPLSDLWTKSINDQSKIRLKE